MINDIHEITDFPHDGRQWRIDMFGQFTRNDNVPSDPQVEIIMSPLKKDMFPNKKLSSNSAVDLSQQQSFWINAGYLPYVHIGAIWKNGVSDVIPSNDNYKFNTFTNVLISEETCHVIQGCDLSFDVTYPQTRLIPPNEWYLGHRGDQTNFLSIDYGGTKHKILISTVEVARFWFFNSTPLTQRLLWGQISDDDNQVFRAGYQSSLDDDGTGRIWLMRGIPVSDRWTVSRFAHSQIAYLREQQIHNSLVVARLNNRPLSPRVLPPFNGQTNLSVTGKWIRSGNQWRFLVFWIDSCTYPFPAKKLIWNSDHDTRLISTPKLYPGQTKMLSIKKKCKFNHPRKRLLSDAEPNLDKSPLSHLLFDSRFPDLEKKISERLPKNDGDSSGKIQHITFIEEIDDEDFSSGLGAHGMSTARPIKVKITQPTETDEPNVDPTSTPPATLDQTKHYLDHLVSITDIEITYISNNVSSIYSDTYSILDNHAWCFVDGHPRQALIAELNLYNKYYIYLYDLERRSTGKHPEKFAMLLLWHPLLTQIEDGGVPTIVPSMSKHRGMGGLDEALDPYHGTKLKHTSHSKEEFAEKITKCFDAIINESGLSLVNTRESESQI